MMLTLLILNLLLQSPAFHYMPQSDTSLIKEMSTLLLLYFSLHSTICLKSPSPWGILWQSALLHHNGNILLLTYPGVPCDYIASWGPHLPFWAIIEVVSWIFAPETCDMTQVSLCRNRVVPGIQSTSLPGLFRSNQGFYFLWVILYFLCRKILLNPHSDNFGRCVLLLHMNSMTWCRV